MINKCFLFRKKDNDDEIQTFLNALKLSYLNKTFKSKNVTMKMLLSYGEQDLKNVIFLFYNNIKILKIISKKVGVFDDYVRQLIVNEVKKFHHKNWLSSSLVPVKHESKLRFFLFVRYFEILKY